ncbi:hypothetical protein V8C34DRAFT_290009 [Trichoderma compactum]
MIFFLIHSAVYDRLLVRSLDLREDEVDIVKGLLKEHTVLCNFLCINSNPEYIVFFFLYTRPYAIVCSFGRLRSFDLHADDVDVLKCLSKKQIVLCNFLCTNLNPGNLLYVCTLGRIRSIFRTSVSLVCARLRCFGLAFEDVLFASYFTFKSPSRSVVLSSILNIVRGRVFSKWTCSSTILVCEKKKRWCVVARFNLVANVTNSTNPKHPIMYYIFFIILSAGRPTDRFRSPHFFQTARI